jgi:hypothetical protein
MYHRGWICTGSAVVLLLLLWAAPWPSVDEVPEEPVTPRPASKLVATSGAGSFSGVPDGRSANLEPGPGVGTADGTGPAGVVISVTTVDGAPIPHATAVVMADLGSRVASCDARGAVFVDRPQGGSVDVVLTARGYVPASSEVSQTSPATVRVPLDKAGSIAGLVLKGDGLPPPAGVRVVAWAADTKPRPAELYSRLLREDPRVSTTLTLEDGSFDLSGLRRDKPYAVTAGGEGWINVERARGVPVDGPPIRILVERLYGIEFSLFDGAAGSPIRLQPSGDYVISTTQHPLPGSTRIQSGSLAAMLAGVAPLSPDGTARIAALMTRPDEAPMAGQVELSVRIPGFLPAELAGPAMPIGHLNDALAVYLQPTAECQGRLALTLAGTMREGTRPGQLLVPMTRVELFDAAGRKLSAQTLGTWPADTMQVDLPCGEFTASLVLNGGMGRWPALAAPSHRITIGDAPAALHIPVEVLGALQLQVLGPDGRAHEGLVHFSLCRSGSEARVHFGFREPPYGLLGLDSGPLELRLIRPQPSDESKPELIEIISGETTHLTVILRE